MGFYYTHHFCKQKDIFMNYILCKLLFLKKKKEKKRKVSFHKRWWLRERCLLILLRTQFHEATCYHPLLYSRVGCPMPIIYYWSFIAMSSSWYPSRCINKCLIVEFIKTLGGRRKEESYIRKEARLEKRKY